MRRPTRTFAVVLAAVLAAGWAALSCLVALAPAAQASTAHAVMMSNYAFAPSSITVRVGDSISWTNHDQAPHNVVTTSAPVTINSPTLSDGQSWSYTFTAAGTYSYICGVHPDMHATVVVLAAAPVKAAPVKAAPSGGAARSAARVAAPTRQAGAISMPSMLEMTSPHPATSSHPKPTSSPAAAAIRSPPVSAAPIATQIAQAGGVSSARLKPLLLVAGVIAAVTVFCLLALASRPGAPTD
jgi:plastocyanin